MRRDPELTTGDALPKAQLYDHIPALLQAFEHLLSSPSTERADPLRERNESAAAHGLHRWQQGYDLKEVTLELGVLNECMTVELDAYAGARPWVDQSVMAEARLTWARLVSVGIGESTSQYFHLQQVEARGHLRDLERALEEVRELEQSRVELWRQTAHDMRGNLGVMANAAAGLAHTSATLEARENSLRLLARNVASLHHLLDDVSGLARLQAGQETRNVAAFDAARLLRGLGEDLRPLAEQRGLTLYCQGPAALTVEGDAVKVRRIAQNLVVNGIKYTQCGGVTVGWGAVDDNSGPLRWALCIEDTGPGFHAGPGAPMAGALEAATIVAREQNVDPGPSSAPVSADHRAVHQQTGEGIGLSIVKRLCELLDASVEMTSTPGRGTLFRIVLPMRYDAPATPHPGSAG